MLNHRCKHTVKLRASMAPQARKVECDELLVQVVANNPSETAL